MKLPNKIKRIKSYAGHRKLNIKFKRAFDKAPKPFLAMSDADLLECYLTYGHKKKKFSSGAHEMVDFLRKG